MERECKTHGKSEFTLRKDGGYRCNKCAVDAVTKRRKKLKVMAVEYKGGGCKVCGYDKCVDALHFHHLDPALKDFAISKDAQTRSWELIKSELDKCVCLCANCHSEVHAGITEINL